MSDCASICEILISHLILRDLEIKKLRLGATPKKTRFFFGFTLRGLRNANHSGLSTVGAGAQ